MPYRKVGQIGWLIGFVVVVGLALQACQQQGEGQRNQPAQRAQTERAKCPVCNMFADFTPDWMAKIEYKDGSRASFDVPHHMLEFYVEPGEHKATDHQKDRTNITRITVKDYNAKAEIDARAAFFVIGSQVPTPMGKGVIPFQSKSDAELFQSQQGGRIVTFNEFNSELMETIS